MANMHRETLKLEAETKVALCRCGQSQNLPYCDGSHRTYQHPKESSLNRSSSPPSQSVSELNQAVKRSLECQFQRSHPW